uniref:Uncharacterized protein n=1 Tax=Oryza punctata TaxID=4537 RepID=A0A0E0L1N8_ORYPU
MEGRAPEETSLPHLFCRGHRHHCATRCAVEEEESRVVMGIGEELEEGGEKFGKLPMLLSLHVRCVAMVLSFHPVGL